MPPFLFGNSIILAENLVNIVGIIFAILKMITKNCLGGNKMRRYFVIFFSLLLVVAIASGCGSKETSGSEDSVLKSITTTKILKVGTDATFPPFEFKNDKNEFDGFDIDLIREVAKVLGADKVEFVDTEFKGLIPGLQAKHFDMVVSAMYITDERKETIDFSDMYFPGGLTIMVDKDNESIKSIQDLYGKKVSVQIGTKSYKYLEENHPEVELVAVEKNVEMFLELESKRVEAVVTGRPAALVYAKESGKVKVLDHDLTQEEYGYGIRKENQQLTEAVNQAIKTLRDNGTYDQIVQKWFGE